MAQRAMKEMTAKEAVNAAFAIFNDFFRETAAQYVLLEGVEFHEDDNQWAVTIGFDIGRQRQGLMIGEGKEPIREKRTIYLDGDDGTFVRMN